MPQALEQPTEKAPPPVRWTWTRLDCERFERDGLLTPGKYELIFGEIVRKMPQKPPHATVVLRLIAWLISVFGEAFVLSQCAVDVSPEDSPTNHPEPDGFALRRSVDHFQTQYPTPEDLALVVEVSDTTLAFDLSTKAGLYARAEIEEYWVLDVSGRALTIHREPLDGIYRSVVRYAADESVATLARPDASVVVSRLLPPLAASEQAQLEQEG